METAQILRQKDEQIQGLRLENMQLRSELDWLKRQIFGQKRERFVPQDPAQLALALGLEPDQQATEVQIETITYERQKAKAKPTGRQPWPSHLERLEIEILPQGNLSEMVQIGEERTEELEYIPASLFVRVFIRPRFVKKTQDEQRGISPIVIAPMPSRPLPKLSIGPGMLAAIVCDKFMDHLPLYRQLKRFERLGVNISSSSISNWVLMVAQLLKPLYEALRKEVLESGYIQADETTIRVLNKRQKDSKKEKEKHKPPGKAHLGYFWVYYAPRKKLAYFEYQSGRSAEGPSQLLKNYQGALQADGYGVYEAFDKLLGITLYGCLAHARRKFNEAKKNDLKRAQEALFLIQKLYAIERVARKEKLSAEQRLDKRQAEAQPIWDKLSQWLIQEKPKVLPKSDIGKAISYLLNRSKYIQRYLEDGKIEIDNNLVEPRRAHERRSPRELL